MINCNDPFSRFEQQILILEKQAERTEPTTERHGHDGPSRVSRPKTLRNSELCNEMAGRTVTGVTDRHRPLVEIWVSELCDDLQDGPSQARRLVTGCAIPVWVGFLDTF